MIPFSYEKPATAAEAAKAVAANPAAKFIAGGTNRRMPKSWCGCCERKRTVGRRGANRSGSVCDECDRL